MTPSSAFSQFFGRIGGAESRRDLTNRFLASLSRISGQDVWCCDGPITAAEVEKALSDCGGDKSQGLDGIPYKLYYSMPDLFGTCWLASTPTDSKMG